MPLVSDITAPEQGTASNLITQFVAGTPEQAMPYLTTGGRIERPDYGMSIAGSWRLKNLYGMRGSGDIQNTLNEATRSALNTYVEERKAEGFRQSGPNQLVKDVGDGQQQIININWATGATDMTYNIGPTSAQIAADKANLRAAKSASEQFQQNVVTAHEYNQLIKQYPNMPSNLALEVAKGKYFQQTFGQVPKTYQGSDQKIQNWLESGWTYGTGGEKYNVNTGVFIDPSGVGQSIRPGGTTSSGVKVPTQVKPFSDDRLKELINPKGTTIISGNIASQYTAGDILRAARSSYSGGSSSSSSGRSTGTATGGMSSSGTVSDPFKTGSYTRSKNRIVSDMAPNCRMLPIPTKRSNVLSKFLR